MTRNENIVWNKNTNRSKTGRTDILSTFQKTFLKMSFGKCRRNISFTSFRSIGIFISTIVFASGYSFCHEKMIFVSP